MDQFASTGSSHSDAKPHAPQEALPPAFDMRLQHALLLRAARARCPGREPTEDETNALASQWYEVGFFAAFRELYKERLNKGDWNAGDLADESSLAEIQAELNRRLSLDKAA